MAKKMTKLLVFGAAVGVAAAGAYYLLKKSDENRFDEDDFDDFDDFEIDDDEDDDYENGTESAERNYVPLNLNMPQTEDADSSNDGDKEPASSPKTVENESAKEETIEEFFDEEDEEKEDDDFVPADE